MGVRVWCCGSLGILLAVVGGCGDDGDSSSGLTSSTSAPAEVLADDHLVAVCLTDVDAVAGGGTTIETDLCTVSLDGDRSVIREGVDPAQRVALSPDRTRVAFIEDGSLHLIDVDGSGETDSGVSGSAPEWIDADRVGLVTGDRTIRAIDSITFEVDTYVDEAAISVLMPTAFIDGFTVSANGADVLFTLFQKPDRASDGFDSARGDRSALGHFTVATQTADLAIGPTDVPLADPDFGPGDQFLVSKDNDIHRGVLGSSATTLVSPEQWLGVTPTWSKGGTHIAWLANGVGTPDGPAVLMFLSVDDTQSQGVPSSIVGNRDRSLERFPAFPDW